MRSVLFHIERISVYEIQINEARHLRPTSLSPVMNAILNGLFGNVQRRVPITMPRIIDCRLLDIQNRANIF